MTMLEKLLKNLTLVRICNTRLSFPNSPMKGMGIGSMFPRERLASVGMAGH